MQDQGSEPRAGRGVRAACRARGQSRERDRDARFESAHRIRVSVDDRGATFTHEDLGARRDLNGLAAGQRGDTPVGGTDLRAVRGERVLDRKSVV